MHTYTRAHLLSTPPGVPAKSAQALGSPMGWGVFLFVCVRARVCVSAHSARVSVTYPEVRKLGNGGASPGTQWSIKRGGSSGTSGTDQQAITFHPRANRALRRAPLIQAIVHLH